MIKMLPDGRMRVPDAAAYLGLSIQTLAMKRCDGTGPTFVKRGRVFYYKDDLDAWLQAGRPETANDRPLGVVALVGCRCRCGHEWLSRNGERPLVCPLCKSPRWDKPKNKEAIGV